MRRRHLLQALFYATVFLFLARTLWGLDWRAAFRGRIEWGFVALGLSIGMLQRFGLVPVWVSIVRGLGGRVTRYRELNLVYARAWLGRYAPGKVAMVAARVYLSRELGVSRSVLLVSSFLEMSAQLLVASVMGLAGVATLAGGFLAVTGYALAGGVALGILALLLVPAVFNTLLRLAWRVLDRGDAAAPPVVPAATVAAAVLGSAGIVAGIGVYVNLLAAAVDPRATGSPLFILGAFSLAGALGTLAPFAPTGLGVKEAVLIPLLALVVPKTAALGIVVLVRLADVAIDLAFYGASRWIASAGSRPPSTQG